MSTPSYFVNKSCSYGGIETRRDHKLVKANINDSWWRKQKTPTSKIN